MIIISIIDINLVHCADEQDLTNSETFCEREGQTICQFFCSPVSFKRCKKNITSKNFEYCCVCEFWEGEFNAECLEVVRQND